MTSFINAKQLSKRNVRQFFDEFSSRTVTTEVLPDDNEKFEGDGIALMVAGKLRGLYIYKALASLQPNTTLYYTYGGMLGDEQQTSRHKELIQALSDHLRTDSKAQMIICLDNQPMQASSETHEEQEFWLGLGFSQLDVQVFYQGTVNVADHTSEQLDFSVLDYAGGNKTINTELCELFREAYGKRQGVAALTDESIEEQLAIPGCAFLLIRHNKTLVGQATLFVTDTECYVDSIYVKRNYWGSGAADVLTQHLVAYAKKRGCNTFSGAAASNNWGCRRLMERFGLVARHQTKRMALTL